MNKLLAAFLKKHKIVGADTMVFIYHLEDHPRYAPLTQSIFEAWERGSSKAVTSCLTLLEVLVKPMRENNLEAVRDYTDLLITYPNLNIAAVNLETAERAARLRARYALRTPDAIQLAAAFEMGATGFLSNDQAHKKVSGIEVLCLDDVVGS